jgi:hypothetical protein
MGLIECIEHRPVAGIAAEAVLLASLPDRLKGVPLLSTRR